MCYFVGHKSQKNGEARKDDCLEIFSFFSKKRVGGGLEMLEGIVADLLAKYLGEYVVGLDAENLRIGVLSGEVFFFFFYLSSLSLFDLPTFL